MSGCYGEIRNGAVILPPDCPLREGQRVLVMPVVENAGDESSDDSPLPLDKNHPAWGMWADRSEMADSVAYSRSIREKLTRRDRHG
jgi:hypothetical protein